jgi:Trk-type K+ transport system membrane component
LLHGAFWTGVIVVLDTGTSWLMMATQGVSSEANATMRLLFENRNLPTFLTWLASQRIYLGLIGLGLALYCLSKLEGRIAPEWVRREVLRPLYGVAACFIWFYAIVRLYVGPPGNMITVLLPYGGVVALCGALVLFFAVLLAMLADARFFAILKEVIRAGKGAGVS